MVHAKSRRGRAFCLAGFAAAFLRGALPLGQRVGVLLCVLPLPYGFCGGFLAPLLAAAAAAWQPPAAKEGQGDCDFPLGPPWILLYPLKRRRSAVGLEAAAGWPLRGGRGGDWEFYGG